MRRRPDGALVLTVLLGLFVVVLLAEAGGFPPSLRLTPYIAGFGTLAMILVLLAGNVYPEVLRWTETTLQDLWGAGDSRDEGESAAAAETAPPWSAVMRSIFYAVAFLGLVFVFGFVAVTPLFIAVYLIADAGVRPLRAVPVALAVCALVVLGMRLLNVEVWAGIGPEIVPDYVGGAIMPPL